jgi:hypothetical protein
MNLHIALVGVQLAAASQFVVARGASTKVLEFLEEALGGAPKIGGAEPKRGAARNPKGTSGGGKRPVPDFQKNILRTKNKQCTVLFLAKDHGLHCRSTESWS